MLPVSAALNTYASASAATPVRRVDPASAPSDNGKKAFAGVTSGSPALRPSAVVNISEQGRAQAEQASNGQAPRSAVNAVQQAAVATSETNALQERQSNARSASSQAADPTRKPNAVNDAIRNSAGPASTDQASMQRKDGVRAG